MIFVITSLIETAITDYLIPNTMKKVLNVLLFIFLFSAVSSTGHGQAQKHKGYPLKEAELDVLTGFVNPPKGYGNVPFYWWNGDTLNKERLKEQLDILSTSATDGFAVSYIHTHPRIDTLENKNGYGLYGMTEPGVPEVFSDDWWEIWNWFSGESARLGMGVGLDDYTVGWPGNGFYPDELDTMAVFQGYQGELVITVDTVLGGHTYSATLPENLLVVVAWPGKKVLADEAETGTLYWESPKGVKSYVYTITTLPGYVIHPEHGNRLVDVYFNRFEQRMDEAGREGMNYFFQDELAYPITMLSWSDDFRKEFSMRKGYDILPYLPALKGDIGPETPKVRLDYCEVLMDLSEERYYKPIYNWHADRGLIYGADNLSRGKDPNAYIDYFRANAWYTAPGNDAPSRGSSFLETKISSSITHLYQRPRTWLEAFHSMGWGSSGAWLTRQIDHHFIAGGNLVCMHGLYYSTHGGWWEWAPPDFHFRMPYWPHMKQWLDYTERMSYLLSQGRHVCDIALLYPTEPLQAYPGTRPDSVFNVASQLSDSGLDYDFVDFRSLRDATISGKKLRISDEHYQAIVLADMKAIHFSSLEKIVDFYRSGGIVLATGELPSASSRIGENDHELDQIVKELFGVTARQLAEGKRAGKQTNEAGGVGWHIPHSLERRIPELITPDFLPGKGGGKVLHRRIGKWDVYMVTDVQKGEQCFFRSKGRVELWDANTGDMSSYPIVRQTDDGTWLRMEKETGNSYLIVFSPGEPEIARETTMLELPSTEIALNGEWEVELLPTMHNKWGDYRFPAFDGLIGAEARSFKYQPSPLPAPVRTNWTRPGFNDSGWNEEIHGYGPQAETRAGGAADWEPVSFSWQYGVWDNPGGQGFHGLKGKVDDRFFILDKGENQEFRTYVYAPMDGVYQVETEGMEPDRVQVNGKEVGRKVEMTKGWHRVKVAYSGSQKVDFRMRTGTTADNRERSFVVFYPEHIPFPEKLPMYADEVTSRWNESGHLMFDPYGGKHREWNFRFETAPGMEEMVFSVYGEVSGIWFNGEEVASEKIQESKREGNRREYIVRFTREKKRIGLIALSVCSEIGYQGASVFAEPVRFKTSSGVLETGDWSQQGALRYYSGGIRYRKTVDLPYGNRQRVTLDLGNVIATCEVKINNKPAGILIAPPYRMDITSLVGEGENVDIEVLVYSTLSNHYQTIPTPYRGEPQAGLIGPVTMLIHNEDNLIQ